ncbi:Phosphatidylinositol 4,5-bisphosphate-binding protein SLM2 [Smittium mucronatum]|uniref:Phosphatidylinositol 4,5-bisphosphate-binding protein SLM2 n=1 Tax=Smittium mucronatum TaxID=133383 RepID=A0A1R0H5V6_9FUNG|nr:Phosphatidylinositol 4,5-bisphosphate-binding protein SLM2 [Smittium mucronatum]
MKFPSIKSKSKSPANPSTPVFENTNPFDDEEDAERTPSHNPFEDNKPYSSAPPPESHHFSTLGRNPTINSSFGRFSASPAVPSGSAIVHNNATTLNKKGVAVAANVGSGDDNDLIIMRLQAWKHIVKALSAFFSAQADYAIAQTKSIPKLDSNLELKLTDSQFFLDNGNSGVLDVVNGVKLMNKSLVDRLAGFSNFLSTEMVLQLQGLRTDIKNEVKSYSDNVSTPVSNINKVQKDIDEQTDKLSKSVESYSKQQFKNDPWLINQVIIKYLKKRVIADDVFYRLMQSEIARLGTLDQSLSDRFSKIILSYTNYSTINIIPNDLAATNFLNTLSNFDTNQEWSSFIESYGSALASPMGRSAENSYDTIDYPHKGSTYVSEIKRGSAEREKGLIKSFTRVFLVLTNLGYLHSFSNENQVDEANPDVSLLITKASLEIGHSNTITLKIPSGYPGKGTQTIRFRDSSDMDNWVSLIKSKMDAVPES